MIEIFEIDLGQVFRIQMQNNSPKPWRQEPFYVPNVKLHHMEHDRGARVGYWSTRDSNRETEL